MLQQSVLHDIVPGLYDPTPGPPTLQGPERMHTFVCGRGNGEGDRLLVFLKAQSCNVFLMMHVCMDGSTMVGNSSDLSSPYTMIVN
jgi:hypothetical protein